MSGAAQFPNRQCPRGNRLHRTESLRHSDSESPASSEDTVTTPLSELNETISEHSVHSRHPTEPEVDNSTDDGHIIQVDRTPPVEQESLAERHLRESILRLQDHLNTSTAIMNNLQFRDQAHRIDRALEKVQRKRLRRDLGTKREAMRRERAVKLFLLTVLCFVTLIFVAYCYIVWLRGPEMEYIRKRRAEILLE